jgi:hypothetical protein
MREIPSHQQQDAIARMRDVLQDEYLTLSVEQYQASEDFAEGRCTMQCTVLESPGGRRLAVEGRGVGLIDAFFAGLIAQYSADHGSLASLRFSSFSVRGLMAESRRTTATDAKAEAEVGVTNSSGHAFAFRATTASVTLSCLDAVVSAVEYFVNSERAYLRIQRALEHYRREGRQDLVAKYTDLAAEMVRNTSYAHLSDRSRQ